jgi:hypothetical protein
MHVAAVIGADVDGVAVAAAQEFEQVQLDLAIARVIARFPPVEYGLRAERPQRSSRLSVEVAVTRETGNLSFGLGHHAGPAW